MFDPELALTDRLTKELGFKGRVPFYPKAENDEEELKYLVTGGYRTFEDIRAGIQGKPNRIVDTDNWTSNQYALVTFNLDTADQRIARNGYSLRVRCALTKQNNNFYIRNIDMCIKTLMPSEKTTILHKQKRGEWETELPTLQPSMAAMIAHNMGKNPPLPDFFKGGNIRDEDLFVESTGCTLRNVFPSYEIIEKRKRVIVPAFQHTEDVCNVFLNPHGDAITEQDSESEAEFLGIFGLDPQETKQDKFDKYAAKSKKLLDNVIIATSPAEITRNLLSKATRARQGLENLYGPCDNGKLNLCDRGQAIEEASRFALSQKVKPTDVSLEVMWHQIEKMRAKVEREKQPMQGTPFQLAK